MSGRHFLKFSQEIYKVILRYSFLAGEEEEGKTPSSSDVKMPTIPSMPSLQPMRPFVPFQAQARFQHPQHQYYPQQQSQQHQQQYNPQQQQQYHPQQQYFYLMIPPAPPMRAPASLTYTLTAAGVGTTYPQCFSPISPAVATPVCASATATTTSSSTIVCTATTLTTPAPSPLPPLLSQQASPDLQSSQRTSTPFGSAGNYGTRDARLPQGPQTPGSATDILRAAVASVGGLPSPAAWSQASSQNWANTSFSSLLGALPTPPAAVPVPPAIASQQESPAEDEDTSNNESGNNNNNKD